jgi:hypothetical protein
MFTAGVHLERNRAPVSNAQRGLEAFSQALLEAAVGIDAGGSDNLDAIEHHIDVVLLVLLERRQVGRFIGRAVDAKTHIALRLHVGEQLGELALAFAHHRRQHHQPRAFGQRQRGIDHLAHTLSLQCELMVGTEGRAGAGIEQAQVVVDLGDGADGGPRVVRGCLLLDADRRTQPFDDVDIGLVHQLQELPRVGAQALDIAPLPFGIQRVECEARFARAAQPGDDHQLMARDVDIDVLQVVRTSAPHADDACFQRGLAGHTSFEGSLAVVRRLRRRCRRGDGHRLHNAKPTIIRTAPGRGCSAAGRQNPTFRYRLPT